MEQDISPLDKAETPSIHHDTNGKFKAGNKAATANKGIKHSDSIDLPTILASDFKQLKKYITTLGVQKFVDALEQLEGKEYITAYIAILPYVKGKIANVDASDEEDKPNKHNITHTVTVKNMMDGSVKTLK